MCLVLGAEVIYSNNSDYIDNNNVNNNNNKLMSIIVMIITVITIPVCMSLILEELSDSCYLFATKLGRVISLTPYFMRT